MARECKRKRDERRFGKPERLADLILSYPAPSQWAFPFGSSIDVASQVDSFWPLVKQAQTDLRVCPIFIVENTCQIYWDSPRDNWKYREDFPNSAPPFKCFFLESINPGFMVIDGGKTVSPMSWCPDRWGAMFWAEECDGLEFETYPDMEDRDLSDLPEKITPGELKVLWLDDARWLLRCIVIGFHDGMPGVLPVQVLVPLDASGKILASPVLFVGPLSIHRDRTESGSMFHSLFKPLLLSVSFIHCKNAVIDAHEPDKVINRERRKAGLKPFVRYHTINIEPMKRILRTEGRVETEGLKKALHICRGHFATYTPERPLFGRVAGTFWIPAHVRGSLKEGVVVSDYNVHAPEPTAH